MIIAKLDPTYLQYSIGAIAMVVVLYIALRLRRKIREDMEKEQKLKEEWERGQQKFSDNELDEAFDESMEPMEAIESIELIGGDDKKDEGPSDDEPPKN